MLPRYNFTSNLYQVMLPRTPAVKSNCQQVKKYHRHISVPLILENILKEKLLNLQEGKENESSLKLQTNTCKQMLNLHGRSLAWEYLLILTPGNGSSLLITLHMSLQHTIYDLMYNVCISSPWQASWVQWQKLDYNLCFTTAVIWMTSFHNQGISTNLSWEKLHQYC